jgi:hypothetical protein
VRCPDMPKYYFRIAHGKFSDASDGLFDFKDDATAWQEMTKVCGDFIGDICRDLKKDSDWHMELLDENKKPLFRGRLVAECLVESSQTFCRTA